jgi:16S rRNA processing protein RimM
MTRAPSPFLEIGYVARPHGVRGELRVVTHDPESETLLDVDSVRIGGVDYAIEQARAVQGAFLLRLAGVGDRNRAELLRGQRVAVDRAEIPLDEGEVFLADLVGCEVVLEDGRGYGTIAAVETGPQDRLVIHDGDVERLLPLVPEFVRDVDLEAGRVTVAPPEDLPESPRR